MFASRILPAPLQGKVFSVGEISSELVNTADPMRSSVWRTQYRSRLVVDLGSAQAVFEGMWLYVGESRRRCTVQRVMADRCEIQFEWFEGLPEPKVGDPVFSQQWA